MLRDVFDVVILAIATILAAVGIAGLMLDEAKAARVGGRGVLRGGLGWTLVWVVGIAALFVTAWAHR